MPTVKNKKKFALSPVQFVEKFEINPHVTLAILDCDKGVCLVEYCSEEKSREWWWIDFSSIIGKVCAKPEKVPGYRYMDTSALEKIESILKNHFNTGFIMRLHAI